MLRGSLLSRVHFSVRLCDPMDSLQLPSPARSAERSTRAPSVFVHATCAILLLAGSDAFGHPESISSLRVALRPGGAVVTLTLCKRDLGTWFPPAAGREYTTFVADGLRREAKELLELQFDDAIAEVSGTRVRPAGPGTVVVELNFKMPPRARVLQIRSKHLTRLPAGHQQLLCIEDQRAATGDEPDAGAEDVRVLLEDTLTTDQDTLSIELPDAAAAPATRPSR